MRTIFNFLGPLTNPAGAQRQLIGVSDRRYLETIAGRWSRARRAQALVVSGEDGLDEISISASNAGVEVADGSTAELRCRAWGRRLRGSRARVR